MNRLLEVGRSRILMNVLLLTVVIELLVSISAHRSPLRVAVVGFEADDAVDVRLVGLGRMRGGGANVLQVEIVGHDLMTPLPVSVSR